MGGSIISPEIFGAHGQVPDTVAVCIGARAPSTSRPRLVLASPSLCGGLLADASEPARSRR